MLRQTRRRRGSSPTGLLVTLASASALVVAMVLASVLTGHASMLDAFAIASVFIGWVAAAAFTRRDRT